jgi:hypothetical protein
VLARGITGKMVTVWEERERGPAWIPFRRPVQSDWSFWLCAALTACNVALAFVRHDGPVRIVDVLGLVLFVPLTWFVLTFVIGLPVAMVRQFRHGWREGRAQGPTA